MSYSSLPFFNVPRCRPADGFLQINGLVQSQQTSRAIYRWNIPCYAGSGNNLFRNLNVNGSIEALNHCPRQFQNTQIMGRPDIDCGEMRRPKEHRPKPDGEVRSIQVGAHGRSVAVNPDRPACKNVSNEVAYGEVSVQRKVGANKGKAACNFHLDWTMPRLKRTHLFGDALAFGVDTGGIEWVRPTEIILRNVCEAGRLFAVDGARTGEKKPR